MAEDLRAQTAAAGSADQKESRLPWSRGFMKRFGIDKSQWIVLCEIIFPDARSERAIEMALAYCRVRGLDVFKRPVHIVQVYDGAANRMIDAIWPGIAELRTMAMRTGQFAGFGQTEFGDAIEKRIGEGMFRFPEWARCTVYRLLAGRHVAFAGPKVFWEETYGRDGVDQISPSAHWRRRPRGQLEKCAEAAALRRAFPEELGSEYAAEEVDSQRFGHAVPRDIGVAAIRRRLEARPARTRQGFSRSNPHDALSLATTHIPAALSPENKGGVRRKNGSEADVLQQHDIDSAPPDDAAISDPGGNAAVAALARTNRRRSSESAGETPMDEGAR